MNISTLGLAGGTVTTLNLKEEKIWFVKKCYIVRREEESKMGSV